MLKEIARMTVILDGEEVYLVKRMINELREKRARPLYRAY